MAEGASVSALGLSNKAVFSGEKAAPQDERALQPSANPQYTDAYFSPLSLNGK